MKTFIVLVKEVHIQPVKIKAMNKNDAIRRVNEDAGEYLEEGIEYSHTLDTETWTVQHVDNGKNK